MYMTVKNLDDAQGMAYPHRPFYHEWRSLFDNNYPISAEGWAILVNWGFTSYGEDATVSGVLADWLEENAQHLLEGATGPDNLAGRLQQCVEWLRARCVNPVCAG